MSYSILYDSVGIRLPKSNTYLTLAKMGDNNVYDFNNKRARSWEFWTPLGTKPYKMEALQEKLEEIRQNCIKYNEACLTSYENWNTVYDDKSFGWHSSWAKYGRHTSGTSYKMVYNFFVKTKFIDFNIFAQNYAVYVHLPFYSINKELEGTVAPERVYVKTEEELLEAITDFSCRYSGMDIRVGISIGDWLTSKEIMERCAPELIVRKINKPKQEVEVDKYYTITVNGNYFSKRTRRGIWSSPWRPQLKFVNEAAAVAKLKRMKALDDSRYKVECINQQTTLYV